MHFQNFENSGNTFGKIGKINDFLVNLRFFEKFRFSSKMLILIHFVFYSWDV
jgi:hypothetical protein